MTLMSSDGISSYSVGFDIIFKVYIIMGYNELSVSFVSFCLCLLHVCPVYYPLLFVFVCFAVSVMGDVC
jgi:hypothetical protein